MNEHQQSKLSKILALANNNPNRAEAEAALLKAQSLLAGPDAIESWLDYPTSRDESWLDDPIPIVEVEVAKDTSPWFMYLLQVLAGNFRVYYMVDEEAGSLGFVGYQQDIDIAKPVSLAARRAAQYLAACWWQQHPDEPLAAQEAYLYGFSVGLYRQFEDQVARENYALMLCRSPDLEAYMRSKRFKKGTGGPVPLAGGDAYDAGIEAGEQYRTGKEVLINGS